MYIDDDVIVCEESVRRRRKRRQLVAFDKNVIYLSVNDVAEIVGVTPGAILRDIKLGRLNVLTSPGSRSWRYAIHPDDAKRYIEQRRAKKRC